jgi:hypothetical protein
MIDVMEEGVDGANALFDALGQPLPFTRRQNPRYNVEGDEAFVGFRRAIDVEGDAGAPEKHLRFALLLAEPGGVFPFKPLTIIRIGSARRVFAARHLVEYCS